MRQALRRFIVENYLFGQEVAFSDDDSFRDRGIIDSTGVLELVSFLEVEFGVRVGDGELLPENLDSINNVLRFIAPKMESPSVQSAGAATMG